MRVNERTMCVDDSNYPVCLIVSNYMNFCEEKEREERILAHTTLFLDEFQNVVCSELPEEKHQRKINPDMHIAVPFTTITCKIFTSFDPICTLAF